ATQDEGHFRELILRVRRETMMGVTDAAILISVLTYALRNLVSVEADNSGKEGRIRWRVRLAGGVAETSEALREWLGRLCRSERSPLPPSQAGSDKTTPD